MDYFIIAAVLVSHIRHFWIHQRTVSETAQHHWADAYYHCVHTGGFRPKLLR